MVRRDDRRQIIILLVLLFILLRTTIATIWDLREYLFYKPQTQAPILQYDNFLQSYTLPETTCRTDDGNVYVQYGIHYIEDDEYFVFAEGHFVEKGGTHAVEWAAENTPPTWEIGQVPEDTYLWVFCKQNDKTQQVGIFWGHPFPRELRFRYED